MAVDQRAIEAAAEVLRALLQRAADEQHAYFHRFPDGNVSLELEWLDLNLLARATVATYLQSASERESGASRASSGAG